MTKLKTHSTKTTHHLDRHTKQLHHKIPKIPSRKKIMNVIIVEATLHAMSFRNHIKTVHKDLKCNQC